MTKLSWLTFDISRAGLLARTDGSIWIGERQRVTWTTSLEIHDDVIKWKYFPRYWPFVRRIHRSPVNSPHKGQWRGALMFTLIYAWINDWVNNREAGGLRRYRGHYDVIVMFLWFAKCIQTYRDAHAGYDLSTVLTANLFLLLQSFQVCRWKYTLRSCRFELCYCGLNYKISHNTD